MHNTIVFFRKIMRGGTNRSFGIEVAELAGVKKDVITRAKEILKNLQNQTSISTSSSLYNEEQKVELSETERVLLDIDVNNVSPMHAFNILSDLVEKVQEKNVINVEVMDILPEKNYKNNKHLKT